MGPGIILLFVLVAVFVMAGIPHLLVWMRNPAAREHLWFGLGSLAAAGAIAAYCASPDMGDAAMALAQRISIAFCVAWLVAMTWFTVEYAASDERGRRLAVLLTLMFAAVLLGNLAFPVLRGPSAFLGAPRPLGLLNDVALLALFALVVDGSVRLWSAKQGFRAVALGVGMGIALLAFGMYGTLQNLGLARLPSPVPYAFLVIVPMMSYELASSVAAARSLSERQRQGLAHTSRLAIVGELTASIAHEINQPLGAILSNADAGEILLERADPPLDEIRQILADIRRDGVRASNVIRQIRTLVRNQEFALEKLDANAVALDVIGLLAQDAQRRRIRVDSALAPAPAHFRGDRARIEQVLLNLMLNAMDAIETMDAVDTREPGSGSRRTIVVGVSRTVHGEVEFRVVDTGPGIPADRIEHLFDSFYTSKAHGMGLGLSIARSIAEAHGGVIRVQNNPDAGAAFRVTLPPLDVLGARAT